MTQSLQHILNSCLFLLAIIFLFLIALMVQYLHSDMQNAINSYYPYTQSLSILLWIWVVFAIEGILRWLICEKAAWRRMLSITLEIIFPPLNLLKPICRQQKIDSNSPTTIFWLFRQHKLTLDWVISLEKWFLYGFLLISFTSLFIWLKAFYAGLADELTPNDILFHLDKLMGAFLWSFILVIFTTLLKAHKLLGIENSYERLEFYIYRIMFLLTLTFLAIAAVLIQYLQRPELHGGILFYDEITLLLFAIWPLFIIERFVYVVLCDKKTWRTTLMMIGIMLLPPLRLAARRCHRKESIWLINRWAVVDDKFYEYLEWQFLYTLLIISLLMIPFWVLELFMPKTLDAHPALHHAVNLGNAIIWASFVFEYVLMLSLSKKPVNYIIKHWLELAIIILPMLALLRPLVLAQSILSKLARIQRVLNMYRARTVLNRLVRLLQVIRLIELWHDFNQKRNPEKYLAGLEEKLLEKQQDMDELKTRIAKTKQLILEKNQYPLFCEENQPTDLTKQAEAKLS